MTRLVVTGGRAYTDTARVFATLDEFHTRRPVSTLIEGAAPGLDIRARAWAVRNRVALARFPAPWSDVDHPDAVVRQRRDGTAYDVTAGTRRNQQMIDDGRPDYGLVFPGGTGTADMRRRLLEAGISFEDIE